MVMIEIPRRNLKCFRGQEDLTPGSAYYSLLLEGSKPYRYTRQDYCSSCWREILKKGVPAATSLWKANVPVPKQTGQNPLDYEEKIWVMLRSAIASETTEARAHAFVLALYLARRKRLVLRQELKQEANTLFLYEVSATEEMLSIPHVALTSREMQAIQSELEQKLHACAS